MITRDEYEQALRVIEAYDQQMNESVTMADVTKRYPGLYSAIALYYQEFHNVPTIYYIPCRELPELNYNDFKSRWPEQAGQLWNILLNLPIKIKMEL